MQYFRFLLITVIIFSATKSTQAASVVAKALAADWPALEFRGNSGATRVLPVFSRAPFRTPFYEAAIATRPSVLNASNAYVLAFSPSDNFPEMTPSIAARTSKQIREYKNALTTIGFF